MESISIDLTPENKYMKLFEMKTHSSAEGLSCLLTKAWILFASYICRTRQYTHFTTSVSIHREVPSASSRSQVFPNTTDCPARLAAPRSVTPTRGLSLASFVRTSSASTHTFLTLRKHLPSGQNQPSFPFSPTLPDNNGLTLPQPEPTAAFSKRSRTVANPTS